MTSCSRSRKWKRVSWASDDKLCQISDSNGAKSDAVSCYGGGGYPAKQLRERIHVPCIHWTCPPKFSLSGNWLVATGEESEEAGAEEGRALKVLEEFYPRSNYVPSNPFVSADVKCEDYDDNLTPLIPIIEVEEMDTVSETPCLEPLVDKWENKTSVEEKQMESSGVETITVGDAEISVKDAELAAAAAVMFFTVLVKCSEQGKRVDTDLLIKFFHDPQLFGKFLKNESSLPESKQASPQISQSSPPLFLPESKHTTLSLPMPCAELPPTNSELTGPPTPLLRPEGLPSELEQTSPLNLPSNSEPSITLSRMLYPPIPLSSPKRFLPEIKEKSSSTPPSSSCLSLPQLKEVQPLTPPASPKVVLPESQHIHPPIPLSSPKASQPVTEQICPSLPISIPKQLPTESKQETPIPLSSHELSPPQPKKTSPPNTVSSHEPPSVESKQKTPPIHPSLKFSSPTPAAQNQMQPPFRAPQIRPVVVPSPGLNGVKARSSTPAIRFAGPPSATSCTVPVQPTLTYKGTALPRPIPVPIIMAKRARPLNVLPNGPIPAPCAMPVRPTFTPMVSILPGPALVPPMWASTARPGSALLSPPIPPSSTTPARPSFTYNVSALPSPILVPAMEAVRPHPVKDADYFKNLVRRHGGDQPENSVHIAPNGVNQNLAPNGVSRNQLQNLTRDLKLGPKEVVTLKNEKRICMFFNTARGCRSGTNCSYLHEMLSQRGSDNLAGEQSAKRMKFGG